MRFNWIEFPSEVEYIRAISVVFVVFPAHIQFFFNTQRKNICKMYIVQYTVLLLLFS